jgi:DNA-directed RNA polymerase specialized sigma24 family protein
MGRCAGKRILDESRLWGVEDAILPNAAAQDPRFSPILALPDCERFVYVLTVLEGCTDRECAGLLGVSPRQIEETRLRALQHFWKH